MYICKQCEQPIINGQYAFKVTATYGYMVSDTILSAESESGNMYHSGCYLMNKEIKK